MKKYTPQKNWTMAQIDKHMEELDKISTRGISETDLRKKLGNLRARIGRM